MPLKLTAHTLERVHPRPPFRAQIAAHIRQAIHTGDLAPGEQLPGEYEIGSVLGVDRATVRKAIEDLTHEGLLIRAPGKRTTVAQPPRTRRLDTKRYSDELARLRAGHDTATAFVADHEADWDTYTVDPVEYSEEAASESDRHYLGLPKGAKVQRRRMVKRLDDEPIQIQRSTIPLKLAKGTLLADPKVQPYPGGTLAELYAVGLIPDGAILTVSEDATGRMPNTLERKLLGMVTPAPVWDIVRVFKTDGQPIEASRVIAPMARNTLHYETVVS